LGAGAVRTAALLATIALSAAAFVVTAGAGGMIGRTGPESLEVVTVRETGDGSGGGGGATVIGGASTTAVSITFSSAAAVSVAASAGSDSGTTTAGA
jgi:hypothetical protein